MESRTKLLGHPIHPMLVVFPLGLLSSAVIGDVLYLLTGNDGFATFAFFAIGIGVIGGLLAAVFGLLDWLAIPKDTRARRLGLVHGVGNVVVTGLFALSFLTRMGDVAYAPNLVPFVLALLGAGIAVVTAWIGGELVYRLSVGLDDGANLDAPSSLSGEPAQPRGRMETGTRR